MLKNKRIILIWAIFIIFHTIIVLALPEDRNPGILLIYATIAVLSKIGLPVFLNSHSGWGWSEVNLIGWSAGIFFWIICYLIIACVMANFIKKRNTKIKKHNNSLRND